MEDREVVCGIGQGSGGGLESGSSEECYGGIADPMEVRVLGEAWRTRSR